MIAARVMRAMATPVFGHLDPAFIPLLDDVRERLKRLFQAPEGSFMFAMSGTGTSGMEATIANLVRDGTRVLAVVTGYFGEQLVEMCRRYRATVSRVDGEWGRAVDPEAVRVALRTSGTGAIDVVACVHAETSTGVLNPIREIAALAREHDALTLVDVVTSLGRHPVDVKGWALDAVYSCTQKCIGAPSGMSPVAWTPLAHSRRVASRSFYFDITLLEDYWVRRKYHHTLSSTLIYALHEALVALEEEGLENRWERHRRHHLALVRGLEAMGLHLLPPAADRLWTVNAVRVPPGIDEAAIRRRIVDRILDRNWRRPRSPGRQDLAGGPDGIQFDAPLLLLFLSALEHVLRTAGYKCIPGAGVSAASDALASEGEIERAGQPS
jgi:alanine-glyoxylate transaminase/serine-glyoxylate transaminase/serine-pyruvate transaminase